MKGKREGGYKIPFKNEITQAQQEMLNGVNKKVKEESYV